MKKLVTKTALFVSLTAACFCLMLVNGFAAQEKVEEFSSFRYVQDAAQEKSAVRIQKGLDNRRYLFLPACADYANLTFTYDTAAYKTLQISGSGQTVQVTSGESVDLSAICSADNAENRISIGAEAPDGTPYIALVTVMRSENLRSLYLVSDDPVNYGRAYVDASKSHEDAKGAALLLDAAGSVDYDDALTQIKGRGNTTFMYFPKKPYQIKLDSKKELVEGAGKSKKWVLLANDADPSLIRNSLTFFASEELGLANTIKSEPIDLYYDAEYRGTYLLTEKVEVGDNRIEISDTDDLFEEANAGNAAYDAPVAVTALREGGATKTVAPGTAGTVKFVRDLIEAPVPENALHHAFLLEFEQPVRFPDELSGFITDRGTPIVTKTPEYLSQEQGLFIANLWQEFEDAVYSPNGFNEKTGKYYYEYCDLDSLVRCYVLNEFVKNIDYYFTSTYFYLPENSDMFTCGPVWDYDIAYGIAYSRDRNDPSTKPEYFTAGGKSFGGALLKIDGFRDEVQKLMAPGGEMYEIARRMYGEDGMANRLASQIERSQAMNYKLWDITNRNMPSVSQPADMTFDKAIANLNQFMETRLSWLSSEIGLWDGGNYRVVTDDDALSLFDRFMAIFNQVLDMFAEMCRVLDGFLVV